MAPSRCRFVVSACLAGEYCRYDGGSNACAAVRELVRRGAAVTACPEGLACLPVPRGDSPQTRLHGGHPQTAFAVLRCGADL